VNFMQKPTETWRPVQGYEGYYKVSNYGRVRGLDRISITRRGRARKQKGKILKPRIIKEEGYLYVTLYSNNVGKQFKIHTLVLVAFIGPRPTNYQGAHGDNNKLNNHIGNLRWATAVSNNMDKQRHGTQQRGATVVGAVLTDSMVKRIRIAYNSSKISYKKLSAIYQVGESTIRDVVKNKTWKHV